MENEVEMTMLLEEIADIIGADLGFVIRPQQVFCLVQSLLLTPSSSLSPLLSTKILSTIFQAPASSLADMMTEELVILIGLVARLG